MLKFVLPLVAIAHLLSSVCCVSLSAAEPAVAGRSRLQWLELARSENEVTRRQATHALAQFGVAATSDLAKLAKDKDAVIRFWSLRGLKHLAADTVADNQRRELLETAAWAKGDSAACVRIEAASLLARLGQVDEALQLLAAELKGPVDGARIQAAAAIEELGTRASSLRDAVKAATGDSNEYVKRITARILERSEK